MQRVEWIGAAALLAAAIGTGAAWAEPSRREAQRLDAVAASLQTAVGDVSWTCEGNTCTGVGPKSQVVSLMKECRKVSAAIGPLTSYQRGGRALSVREIATCNRLAGNAGYAFAGAAR
jgi:hypothetical protein